MGDKRVGGREREEKKEEKRRDEKKERERERRVYSENGKIIWNL